ncbi:MAG: AI-2E family transporter [Oscillospiraceae bacterium]|nr:AI-2E family transporter [Oscillospiraceae bacterium]
MFKETMKKYGQIFILITLLIIIYFAIINIVPLKDFILRLLGILSPFLLGLLFALLLYVPNKKLESFLQKRKIKPRLSRVLALVIVYFITFIIITIIIKFIFPVIYNNMKDLFSNIPTLYNNAMNYLKNIPEDSFFHGIDFSFIYDNITIDNLQNYLNIDTLLLSIRSVFSVASAVFSVIIGIILSVYILFERNNILSFIQRFLKAVFNKKTEDTFSKYLEKSSTIFSGFINGQLLDALVIGTLCSIALAILQVKYALTLGTLIGIANLIPYFGAIFAVGATIIITLFTGGFWKAFWVFIVIIVLQQIDANIINPKILSQRVKISPLLVILAVTIGGGLFGVIGMFLGVPVMALIKVLVMDYIQYRERKKIYIDHSKDEE